MKAKATKPTTFRIGQTIHDRGANVDGKIVHISQAGNVTYETETVSETVSVPGDQCKLIAEVTTPEPPSPAVDLYRLLRLIIEVKVMLQSAVSEPNPEDHNSRVIRCTLNIAGQTIATECEKSQLEWDEIVESFHKLQWEAENMVSEAATAAAYARVEGGAS